MRKATLLTLILIFSQTAQARQDLPASNPGESPRQLAKRIIPKGKKLMHPVIEADFGATKANIIILFNGEEDRGFTGWLLVPEGDGYKKLTLPERPFPVYTKIRAVFFANADQDKEKELLVLCEHISGVGHPPGNITPFYTTYVYDWEGNRITELEDIEKKLEPVGKIRTARQIRYRLKKLGY